MRLVNEQPMETLPKEGKVWYAWKGVVREELVTPATIRKFPIYTYEELGSRPSYPTAAPLKEMKRIYPDIFMKEKKMTTPNAGLYVWVDDTFIREATLSEIKDSHPKCETCKHVKVGRRNYPYCNNPDSIASGVVVVLSVTIKLPLTDHIPIAHFVGDKLIVREELFVDVVRVHPSCFSSRSQSS